MDPDLEIRNGSLRFIDRRMDDPAVLRWAARLTPRHEAERDAVRQALEFRTEPIGEPYASAWRCVLEMWRTPPADTDMKVIGIFEAIGAGVGPGWLLDDIVALVAPTLRLEDSEWGFARKPPRRPRTVTDLLSVRLDAGCVVGLANLGLDPDRHLTALGELADRLEGELIKGLSRAGRLGGTALFSANWIARVYPPPPAPDEAGDPDDEDPDRFRHGFVPLVRLLSEILAVLADRDPPAARRRVERLKRLDLGLARRLWAASARDPRLVEGAEVATWLLALPQREFWSGRDFPEIAELRARRFGDLDAAARGRLEARLRRRPPASHYRHSLAPDRRERVRTEVAAHELRRIEAAGHSIGPASTAWLRERGAADDAAGDGVEHNLFETDLRTSVAWGASEVRDYLERGADLLQRLNAELAGRLYTDGRPAMDFVTANADLVFDTLVADPSPQSYPRVWAAVASAASEHRTSPVGPDDFRFGRERAAELLAALSELPPGGLDTALDGVASWLDRCAIAFRGDARFGRLWLAVWPAAVAATNAADGDADHDNFPDDEKLAVETLNSPVGRLMVAFRTHLPPLGDVPRPFELPVLAEMRSAAMAASGAARLHAIYHLLILLPYLRAADPDWTQRELLPGLLAATGDEFGLWDAISRIGVLPPDTMTVLGPVMMEAAAGSALPEEVRARLAERVTISTLLAQLERITPPCAPADVQQMLRRGGDAVRVQSARALSRFVARRDASPGDYRAAVRPFLQACWPMDRLTLSPSLSEAFATLPARAGADDFTAAVGDLGGLLVPFNAWSIWAYGLFERGEPGKTLVFPKAADHAWALLTLFDLTVGDAEDSIVPRDLGVALAKMAELSPPIERDPRFQRLSSFARRS